MNLQQILKIEKVAGWIWTIPENLRQKAEEIHEMWLIECSKAAKERHKEVQLVRKSVKEWAESPEMINFAKKARLRYLKDQLNIALVEQQKIQERYDDAVYYGQDATKWQKMAEGVAKRIKGYKLSIDVLAGRRKAEFVITDEMVERAREFPVKELVEVGVNGRAKCVFHKGENFNMDIRNNFAYCHVCQKSGDSISVYRAVHDCGFQEAVLALQ